MTEAKEELSENVAKLMSSEQALRDDVRGLERKLSDARDDLVRAGSMAKAKQEEDIQKEGNESVRECGNY